jgi:sensor histidine kinase YesM
MKGGVITLKKLNDLIADLLADALSSMICFWIITSMVVVVLFWQRPTSLVGWITYISTAIFQASALPVLAFVAKNEGEAQQNLLQETHDTVMGELDKVGTVLQEIYDTHKELRELVGEIHVKVVAGEVDVTVSEENAPVSAES